MRAPWRQNGHLTTQSAALARPGSGLAALRRALPKGGLLPDDVWRRRHRAILALLASHAVVIALAVALREFDPIHAALEGSIVALSAIAAALPGIGRRTRAMFASFGLLSASAILVHLSGGYIEMHFHFFVMIIVISLYQEWRPFLLAVGYVIAHHGLVGTIDPGSVYNHSAAIEQPWLWAGIHGAFILGASVAAVAAWRLNEDLAQRQLETEQRARVAAEAGIRARETFLSIATHELRTPVTSIKGYAQLALRSLEAADHGRLNETLRTLNGQTDRLSRLITQLLDVSRIEGGRLSLELVRTDLGLLILTLVEVAKQQSKTHRWAVDVPTGLHVMVDGERIEQVVTNLLENAIRYSPDGGTISVRLAHRAGLLELAVADEGIGIPPERIDRIFERFYQAHVDRNYGGMGLGLYISKEIVERHGGSIAVTSQPGRGTTFTVKLPAAIATAQDVVSQHSPGPSPVRRAGAATGARGGPIWVVEDDEDIRSIVTSVLRDAGYEARPFATPHAALDALDTATPALILLDKLMPEMDGTGFIAALAGRSGPRPPVVGMCAARDAAEWATSIGAVGYVPKPFEIDQLLDEIARHLPARARTFAAGA